jgi:hypothetical protein
MKRVTRLDAGVLRKPVRMDNGFLRVDAQVARVGVQEYLESGKVVRELRLPEEVGAPEALASYEGASYTDGHPHENGKAVEVTLDNAKRFSKGSLVGRGRLDGDWVVAPIVITDKAMIAKLERGDTGCSVGYRLDVDETPGVHPIYGSYHRIQRNIRVNHVAGAVIPRAGDGARVRMDAVAVSLDDINDSSAVDPRRHPDDRGTSRGDAMDPQEQIRALNAELKQKQERLDALEIESKEQRERAGIAEGKLATVQSRNDELQVQIAAQQTAIETEAVSRERTRADAAEALVSRFDATLDKRVRARATLIQKAQVVMGAEFRTDDLDDRSIMTAVVKRLDATADVSAGVETGVITGRFESLVAGRMKTARILASVGDTIADVEHQRADRDDDEREKKRLAYENQWQEPLPNSRAARAARKVG